MAPKPRIAVVSPFLDKQHGTERCVVEELNRLASNFEIHVYSQLVQDLDLGTITWHRTPQIPGPYLAKYLWWFVTNHIWRWRDSRFRNLPFRLVFSPGINCLDADLIAVHIVFAEFHRRVKKELGFRRNPWSSWPRLIHRRISYWLLRTIERRTYTRKSLPLAVVSQKVAADLARHYARTENLFVVYNGVDSRTFHPKAREELRASARRCLRLAEDEFALLLVGNDWKKKGLSCLLEAIGRLQDPKIRAVVVGEDDPDPYQSLTLRHRFASQVSFLPPRPDIEFYYAAADACVAPSLEDAFALPPLEAMACGLPVIVSRQAGVSEIILDGVNGLILEEPSDSRKFAELIQQIHTDAALRQRLSENAIQTARQYTWEKNASEMRELFEQILSRRVRG